MGGVGGVGGLVGWVAFEQFHFEIRYTLCNKTQASNLSCNLIFAKKACWFLIYMIIESILGSTFWLKEPYECTFDLYYKFIKYKIFVSTCFCFEFLLPPLLVESLNFSWARVQVDKMRMKHRAFILRLDRSFESNCFLFYEPWLKNAFFW